MNKITTSNGTIRQRLLITGFMIEMKINRQLIQTLAMVKIVIVHRHQVRRVQAAVRGNFTGKKLTASPRGAVFCAKIKIGSEKR